LKFDVFAGLVSNPTLITVFLFILVSLNIPFSNRLFLQKPLNSATGSLFRSWPRLPSVLAGFDAWPFPGLIS
jgi:hypothetical protein